MISPFSNLRRLALLLCTAVLVSEAAPSPDEIILAKTYAPLWKFHKDEIYFPSTVEDFLPHVKALDGNGNVVLASVNTQNVDDPPNQGSGLYLSTDIDSGKNGFLRGKNPSTSPSKAYTFVVPKPNNVLDIYYWLYTPFNKGKDTPLGEIGDHVGDWERITVRTVNKVATQVDYHAHDDTGSGTLPWSQVPKFDNNQRPVAYSALGSHGFWSSAGTFTYKNLVIFKLQDETSDGGAAWDVQNDLQVYRYTDSEKYTGTDDWLNYKGCWGNKGSSNCWWYSIFPQCQVVDGPIGPLRPSDFNSNSETATASSATSDAAQLMGQSMSGRLMHTLGMAKTSGSSTYMFYVEAPQNTDAKNVVLKQQCGPPASNAVNGVNGTDVSLIFEPTTNNTASTPFLQATKFTVPVDACAEGTTVMSYMLGLCKDDQNDCNWGNVRPLRAFSADPSVLGAQDTKAIDVEDLDMWKW